MTLRPVDLQGACLYLPATHPALKHVADGKAKWSVRVATVCMEDALHDSEVETGLSRINAMTASDSAAAPRLFLRPRSLEMLRKLVTTLSLDVWSGFVLPKLTAENASDWLGVCEGSGFALMPILETADVFDPFRLRDLVAVLEQPPTRQQISVVRIGGTDLFAALGTRRPQSGTIYDSLIGPTVRQTACLLFSRGFEVSAPVCERIAPSPDFLREARMDVEAGFVGKTAVHPSQVLAINRAFQVTSSELDIANRVLAGEAAVFATAGLMSESRPHRRWAKRIVLRSQVFGTHTGPEEVPEPQVQSARASDMATIRRLDHGRTDWGLGDWS